MLEKQLSAQSIELPKNPFWSIFQRFGRDELIAMGVNLAGTASMDYMLNESNTKNLVLALSGPIIEKIGFFPAHFYEAYDDYKKAPKDRRAPRFFYTKKAFRNGTTSLVEDVIFHDPLYVGLMYAGLQSFPGAPSWIVAGTSFTAAVFAVAGAEVAYNEWQYKRLKKKLAKAGFEREEYYESRFYIQAEKDPSETLQQIASKFGLATRQVATYDDCYYHTQIPEYSGRKPKVRLRKRVMGDGKTVQSAQIVFTRTGELEHTTTHRFYPQKKEKMYFILNQEMPKSIDEITNTAIRNILKKATVSDEEQHVSFQRTIAHNPVLLATTDYITGEQPFYVLELKVRKDTVLLKEAMRYVMSELPVIQTTYGKQDLVNLNTAEDK